MARFSSTAAQRAVGAAAEGWLSRFGDALADWVVLLALLVAAAGPGRPQTALALMVLARVLPRLVLLVGAPAVLRRVAPGMLVVLALGRAVIAAGLGLAGAGLDLTWLAGAALIYGTLSTLAAEGRAALAPRRSSAARLGRAGGLIARVEAVGLVAGPALAAAALWPEPASTRLAFGLAALLLAGVTLVLWLEARFALRAPETPGDAGRPAAPRFDEDPPKAWRPLARSNLSLVAVARFGGAAMATAVVIALLPLGAPLFDPVSALPGIALALVGLGALGGLALVPRTVPRLLGRIPVALLLGGGVAATAVGVLVLSLGRSLILGAAACLALGAAAVIGDAIAAIAIKRQAADSARGGTGRQALLPTAGGQTATAVIFALAATSTPEVTVPAVAVALGSVALVGLAWLIGEGQARLAVRRAAAA
jgi:MFS family permease